MKRLLFVLLLLIPSRLFAQPACTDNVASPTASNVQAALTARGDNYVVCMGSTSGMGGSGIVPANMSDWTAAVDPTLDSMGGHTIAGEIRGAGGFNSTCLQYDNSTPASNIIGGCGSAQQTKLYVDNGTGGFLWHTTTSTHSIIIDNVYFYRDANSANVGQGDVTPGNTNSAVYVEHHNDHVTNGDCNGFNDIIYTNRGLLYRNRFITLTSNTACSGKPGNVQAIQHADGGNGMTTWSSNSTFGSADDGTNNLYIEQNYFRNYTAVNDLHDGGAREVWRFNELHNVSSATHGFDSTGLGGGRGQEWYNNAFYCDEDYQVESTYITSRTGTGFFHTNTFPAYPVGKCSGAPTIATAITVNAPQVEECGAGGGAWGWPGQGKSQDATHNSYPIPHQFGWGYNSGTSPGNTRIGTSPTFGAPLINQTNQPGEWLMWTWPLNTNGVEQSLEPAYVMNNTNLGITPVISVKPGATNCRAQAWSAVSKANSQTLVVPDDIPTDMTHNIPIPYANVGQQAVMVLADLIGSGTITPTIKVNGSNSCGTITALTAGTSGSMRLSAWTCTITADGPQTVTFTSSASASTAARAGTVIFMRGLRAASLPFDKNPAVATVSTSPFTATTTGTLTTCPATGTTACDIVIGYFALPVSTSTDNLQPGSSETLTQICNFQCDTYPGGALGYGKFVGTFGTSGGSDVSVATDYRVVSAATGVTMQQLDLTQNVTSLAGSVAFVANGSTDNFATDKTILDMNSTDFIKPDIEYYGDYGPNSGDTAFNGTTGTGAGPAASIPNGAGGVCTGSVGYWATDVGSWNTTGYNSGVSGALFTCGVHASAGHWPATLTVGNASYVPYIAPHPNDTVGAGNTQFFSSQPTTAVTGSAFSPTITVTVSPAAADSITLSVTTGTCTFTGTATQTSNAGTGIATFTGLTANATGTGCVMTAHNNTDGTISNVTSNAFNITASCTPSKLAFTAQPSSSVIGASLGVVTVQVQDAGGNYCNTDTSTITIANKAATCTGMTLGGTTTGANQYSASNLTENAVGACTLHATDGALTAADSSPFTISVPGNSSRAAIFLRHTP